MNAHAPPERKRAGDFPATSPKETLNEVENTPTSCAEQATKRNSFSLMNNIRDYCELPSDYRDLLFTMATYCGGEGICWPGNDELSRATRKPRRTLQRMLNHLVNAKHIKILSSGRGRDQKRIICLQRYVQVEPKNVIPITDNNGHRNGRSKTALNAPPMSGAFKCASPTSETCTGNYHIELPNTPKGVLNTLTSATRQTRNSASGVPSVLEKYDEAQRELIGIYHAKLCKRERGWLRVTEFADSVVDALDGWEPEAFAELCDDAANNGPCCPPKTKSIVRLSWHNY